jgi:hypothetical protein
VSRRSSSPARQLSLIEQPDAAPADTVDEVVTEDQPSKRRTRRTRQRRPRPRGTGAVFEKGNRWYGQWYLRGRLVKRSLGAVREPGSREGLTRTQAEARLPELMLETSSARRRSRSG